MGHMMSGKILHMAMVLNASKKISCCVCHVTYRSIAQCYKLQPCVCYIAFAYVTEMFDTHHQR
jgi:hypothetical protein